MNKHYMTRPNCPAVPNGYNNGEAFEWEVGYELTGEPSKRNNKSAEKGGDVGEWQVKSPKASLTGKDNCTGYIFGVQGTGYFYEMNPQEFESFVNAFSYVDRDSKSGKMKIRIKNDSKKMREWLDSRC